MKVALLKGGKSGERDVSLRTGSAIAAALRRKNHEVIELDAAQDLTKSLADFKPDVVFIALHGRGGEDGCVQGFLEWQGYRYTSSGILSSALCFNKLKTKEVAKAHGFFTAPWFVYYGEDKASWKKDKKFQYPLVVKPNTEGSSIGVSRVQNEQELDGALDSAFKLDSVVLVESLIVGREVTVGVLNQRPLTIVEVRPKGGFYDYHAKYTAGQTEYLVPAPLEQDLVQKLQKNAQDLYRLFDCRGAVRADFIVTANGDPYLLEINTIPGMTETSLLPKAAKEVGISFDDLCEAILQGA